MEMYVLDKAGSAIFATHCEQVPRIGDEILYYIRPSSGLNPDDRGWQAVGRTFKVERVLHDFILTNKNNPPHQRVTLYTTEIVK